MHSSSNPLYTLLFLLIIFFYSSCTEHTKNELERNSVKPTTSNQYTYSENFQETQSKQNVSKLDSLSTYLAPYIKNCTNTGYKIIDGKETWSYCSLPNKIELLIYKKKDEKTIYKEIYSLQNSGLIYAFEEIKFNYDNPELRMYWNCIYGIENRNIYDYYSLGHGETETDEWEPQSIFSQWKEHKEEFQGLKIIAQ